MKQKIVIKMQMHCEKCRNKALKTAAEVEGVTSVALDGDDKDRVVVTGDNVNTICLANQLSKKFRSVTIVSVEEVKKKVEEKKEEKKPCTCAVLCLPAPPPQVTCAKCSGKCEHCSKCKCDCKCIVISCSKCQNPKCDGTNCTLTICFKCQSTKCQCGNDNKAPEKKPPTPQPVQCPPWCTCPRCYVPYNYPIPPCTYRVVYDSNPDGCSIM